MSSIKSALAGTPFQTAFNPAYDAPTVRRYYEVSRRAFVTDMYINGEYLRSRTDNQYFCVVDKPRRSATSTPAISVIWTKPRGSGNTTPKKHVILRLEFVKINSISW
jgi:hypothetical protein